MKLSLHHNSKAEQRRFPRVSARIQYLVVGEEPSAEVTFTKDISCGGMCVFTKKKWARGAVVSLAIALPGGASLQTKGRVVREEKVLVSWSNQPWFESAIEFVETSTEVRQRLSSYIMHYQPEAK